MMAVPRLIADFVDRDRILAAVVLALLVALRLFDPLPLEELRQRGFDLLEHVLPRVYQPMRVRIVAIDEPSLAAYGRWPWSRARVAELVERIAEAQPLALGIDILFTERDNLSGEALRRALPDLPPDLAERLLALPDGDRRLAAALRQAPSVLGLAADPNVGAQDARGDTGPVRLTGVTVAGVDDPVAALQPYLRHYPGLQHSLNAIAAAERGRGALNGEPDADGIVRRVPLILIAQNNLVPALAVEVLRVADGAPPPIRVELAGNGLHGVGYDDVAIPTDRRGRAYPYFTPFEPRRYVSAKAVMAEPMDEDTRSALSHSIVLLGVTGLGLVDRKETPAGPMQGIEIHAQLIEAAIAGAMLRRPTAAEWGEPLAAILAGLIAVFALPYGRLRVTLAGATLLTALPLGAELVLFRTGLQLVDGIFPALSTAVVFATMLGSNLRSAQAARRRLAGELERQREATARLEGELNAARAIQMGLLPRHASQSIARRDVDLEAFIEPARTVGGDLYDFLMIDRSRLFFAIADVSGKGVPAALFMAMTKEVLRAAVLRHGIQLDRALEEANAKIAAASTDMASEGADMMFVTVIAGVLDLQSGDCSYATAGHDAPFIVRSGAEAQQLSALGGPPLGALDEFDYPINRHRLMPGDLLLLFTDGVTEAQDGKQTLYSLARLGAALSVAPAATAKGVIEHTMANLNRFVAGAEQADDITILALKWRPAS